MTTVFQKRLKEALEKRHMRQVDLAEKTGLTRGIISSYLYGRYKAKGENVALMAKALGVDPSWLSGVEDVPMGTTQEERDVLSLWRTLSDRDKGTVKCLLTHLAENKDEP